MTSSPSNTSEWQLYRVLQRANLLQYYETFIAQGGDDVQQLCEAGEEEFLEIMALVGMASKPLHVRRLQKALQEWVANPAAFQAPGPSILGTSSPTVSTVGMTTTPMREQAIPYPMHSTTPPMMANHGNPHQWSPNPPPQSISPTGTPCSSGGSSQGESKELNDKPPHSSASPLPTPVLVESQINSIAEAAARLAKELPPFEPKPLNMKRQLDREIQALMQMPTEDNCRMEELRKYAAIYGRFDSKRKNLKPMSLHEISVNEASAQICRHIPALLTRREDLFPLARQVVRDSGYQYSKGHSSLVAQNKNCPSLLESKDPGNETAVLPSAKRPRLEMFLQRIYGTNNQTVKAELDKIQREVCEQRMSMITQELLQVTHKQEDLKSQISGLNDAQDSPMMAALQTELEQANMRHQQLLMEQSEILRKQRRTERYRLGGDTFNGDDDITDSSNLGSPSSSPGRNDDGDSFDSVLRAQLSAQMAKNPQGTLFEEGLRIAQQYGMADFANELKELQPQYHEGDQENNQSRDIACEPSKVAPPSELQTTAQDTFSMRQLPSESVYHVPIGEPPKDSNNPVNKISLNGTQIKQELVMAETNGK